MASGVDNPFVFHTERLAVGPWRDVADWLGVDLPTVLSALLSPQTTVGLPESWQQIGPAAALDDWADERDDEASMYLAVDQADRGATGLLIAAELPVRANAFDVRVGYLLAEEVWGKGLATELMVGFIGWLKSRDDIVTITAGVAATNVASRRVLEKCGFQVIGSGEADGLEYQLVFAR